MPDKTKGWVFVTIAVVGLAVGFALSSLAYRRGWLRTPHAPFIERMQRDLNLTPEERSQILQIIGETRSKVMALRIQFEHQRHAAIMQARARVRAVLTPEQRDKFDRDFKPPPEHMRERYRDMRDEGSPPPPEGGPPPPAPEGQRNQSVAPPP